MIRRSSAIALLALGLSLVLHLLGVQFTMRGTLEPQEAALPTETARVGTAFEDLAEAVAEPVAPETAPEPEPEAEPPPEPEPVETPTSRALVASENPQEVFAPDTGSAPSPQPESSGPVSPEVGETPEPETVTPSSGAENEIADTRVTSPVGADTVTELPEGAPPPQTTAEPVEAEQFAALPAPSPPVVAAPTLPVAPVAPVDTLPVAPVDPAPETQSPDVVDAPDADAEGQGLTSSLRPPLPQRRPDPQTAGIAGGTEGVTTPRLAPSELIESPLTAYQRDGTDLFAGRSGGARSGGSGFSNSRGPGNSDVTNYAGQVLVHLNNAPSVAVSSRGWARVFFVIAPDGSLVSVDIIDGSGSIDVERAARAHVRGAAPFPRPPEGRTRRLNFVYQVRR